MRLRGKPVVFLTPAELAFLNAFDLARESSGETAHILAGVRAGLYASGVGRKAA